MDKTELLFEMYKEGKILSDQIEDWTDEMKWWLSQTINHYMILIPQCLRMK